MPRSLSVAAADMRPASRAVDLPKVPTGRLPTHGKNANDNASAAASQTPPVAAHFDTTLHVVARHTAAQVTATGLPPAPPPMPRRRRKSERRGSRTTRHAYWIESVGIDMWLHRLDTGHAPSSCDETFGEDWETLTSRAARLPSTEVAFVD